MFYLVSMSDGQQQLRLTFAAAPDALSLPEESFHLLDLKDIIQFTKKASRVSRSFATSLRASDDSSSDSR